MIHANGAKKKRTQAWRINQAISNLRKEEDMKIGKREFDFASGRSVIMGILNVTPDSFSDGGKFNNIDSMLKKAEQMLLDGVDIFDVGGESTRPSGAAVSAEEEQSRVIPAVTELKKRFDVPISVDTYRASTAKEVLNIGADFINDVWGLKYPDDKSHEMAKVIAEYNCPVIIMHNRESMLEDALIGKSGMHGSAYIDEIVADLNKSLEIARKEGIAENKIILDPGIGFAKSLAGNIHAMNNAEIFTGLGYPVLLGISRKSLIGKTLDLNVDEREEATIALNVMGRMKGHHIFRVHDVRANRRALDMTDAVLIDGGR